MVITRRVARAMRRFTLPYAAMATMVAVHPALAQGTSLGATLWGDAAPTAAYLDMWGVHLRGRFPGVQHDEFFGADVRGWYGATFLNSHRQRCWVGGIERNWVSWTPPDHWRASIGYRLGVVYGYDERLFPLARNTPVLFAPEIMFDLEWRRAGIQVGYAWVVVTAGFYVRFGGEP